MKAELNNLEIENDLNGILSPVAPSNVFIEELHRRLKTKKDIIVEYPNYLMPSLIILSGLVTGAVILWILSKFFILILNRRRN